MSYLEVLGHFDRSTKTFIGKMKPPAFTVSGCTSLTRTMRHNSHCILSPRPSRYRYQHRQSQVIMQIPPPGHVEPPLTPEEKGPPGYKWNPDYPGTLKPGLAPDNFPLEEVLSSGVYERMEYQELEMDEKDMTIFAPDEDLLEWLAKEGRLIPRGASDDEFETEAERQISGITEEDLDFADDDSKMIAYYSRQGEGSSAGASPDFGGFSESSGDTGLES